MQALGFLLHKDSSAPDEPVFLRQNALTHLRVDELLLVDPSLVEFAKHEGDEQSHHEEGNHEAGQEEEDPVVVVHLGVEVTKHVFVLLPHDRQEDCGELFLDGLRSVPPLVGVLGQAETEEHNCEDDHERDGLDNTVYADVNVQTHQFVYAQVLEEGEPGHECEPLEDGSLISEGEEVVPIEQLHHQPQDVEVGPYFFAVLEQGVFEGFALLSSYEGHELFK